MKVRYIGEKDWCLPELIKGQVYTTDINKHFYGNEFFILYPNLIEVRLTPTKWTLTKNPLLFDNKLFEVVE